ncbi:MAG TPA: NAD(P)-binding domain-containing protein [Candidatus Dormibacteraeota bacterium]|nr:NAD(P)-binding domain-containing protein [Candidatus Dormibacteraeota bacterium]
MTVIGLGLMGSALASAFQRAGHELTIWNRSAAKAEPFRSSARVAANAGEAVEASDLIVVSLLNYRAGNEVLRTPEVEGAIAGKTIVQLTTGTPNDARDSEVWAHQHGATYLDGAISGYPRTIATDGNEIFYSGDAGVFESRRGVLAALGGTATFCGEAVGSAAALDLAALEFSYARAAGLLHAAALCAAESFPLDVLFTTVGAPAGLLEFASRHDFTEGRAVLDATTAAAAMARPRTYTNSVDATLSVHTGAIDQIVRASREAGIDSAFPQALHDAYSRAVARGHGDHDLPSLYEAFSPDGAGR